MSDIGNVKSSLSSISFILNQLNSILDNDKPHAIPETIAQVYIKLLEENYPVVVNYLFESIPVKNRPITISDKVDIKKLPKPVILADEVQFDNALKNIKKSPTKFSPRKSQNKEYNKIKSPEKNDIISSLKRVMNADVNIINFPIKPGDVKVGDICYCWDWGKSNKYEVIFVSEDNLHIKLYSVNNPLINVVYNTIGFYYIDYQKENPRTLLTFKRSNKFNIEDLPNIDYDDIFSVISLYQITKDCYNKFIYPNSPIIGLYIEHNKKRIFKITKHREYKKSGVLFPNAKTEIIYTLQFDDTKDEIEVVNDNGKTHYLGLHKIYKGNFYFKCDPENYVYNQFFSYIYDKHLPINNVGEILNGYVIDERMKNNGDHNIQCNYFTSAIYKDEIIPFEPSCGQSKCYTNVPHVITNPNGTITNTTKQQKTCKCSEIKTAKVINVSSDNSIIMTDQGICHCYKRGTECYFKNLGGIKYENNKFISGNTVYTTKY